MKEILSEPMGFKYTVGGFAAWFYSIINNVDITQVIGFVGLVIGLAIQISSWVRNRKMDKLQDAADVRSRAADDRDKAQYDLQMKVLSKQLADIERESTNGDKS